MDAELMHVGKRAKTLAHQAELSQTQLAKKMGVLPQRVNSLFTQQNWNTDTLNRFVNALGISWSEFIGEAPSKDETMLNLYQQLADCQRKLLYYQQKFGAEETNT